MFRCLSHRAALGVYILGAVLLCTGCVAQESTQPYHLICWTDPPNCGPCAHDAPQVERLAEVMDVRFPDPGTSPDHRIPFYKFYSPKGRLLYSGHSLDEVMARYQGRPQ